MKTPHPPQSSEVLRRAAASSTSRSALLSGPWFYGQVSAGHEQEFQNILKTLLQERLPKLKSGGSKHAMRVFAIKFM
ncbi:hypothetical protein [Roseovarius mucosus]|uniref:hypothetical protein n=1 Tax=Roseovarius mucosus TaxID=215743 RepID=UPI0012FB69BC|nr:hypothetical protein [Roseovarius mucosus]